MQLIRQSFLLQAFIWLAMAIGGFALTYFVGLMPCSVCLLERYWFVLLALYAALLWYCQATLDYRMARLYRAVVVVTFLALLLHGLSIQVGWLEGEDGQCPLSLFDTDEQVSWLSWLMPSADCLSDDHFVGGIHLAIWGALVVLVQWGLINMVPRKKQGE